MDHRYSNFAELAESETEGVHYWIRHKFKQGSALAIVAPHGGTIEPGTGEIACALAEDDFTWYSFESKRVYDDNYVSLHITSHLFDEPQCLDLVKRHRWIVTIHGCNDIKEVVYLGGLEERLIASVGRSLDFYGIPNSDSCERFPGTHRDNLCNKGERRKGLQLEVSVPLREAELRAPLVRAVKAGLTNFLDDTSELA